MMSNESPLRVLLLNGSPHAHGCTHRALTEIVHTLEQENIHCELIHVGHLPLHGCVACNRCNELGKCTFDDIVNTLAPKFEQADGLIIGSPVYYASPNGTILSLLDRLFYSTSFDKRMKVGAAIVSARRGGTTATFDALNKYFSICGMPIATSQYWNQVHGRTAEDVEQDLEGLQTMRTLARNMAFLMKAIALGKAQLSFPIEEPKTPTHFIR
ncbi:MAG: flavodoxin family protein [Paludibacter sp.]|nr:flavodoxin family protein [Bacteroidales bacterium]MCM1069624.1 flavodoxin family protein [Prevotella sp.]MCM1354270.1 flavodoxin family protein [Bacteroides sp.]MCM1443109.1 flavodoxin family protein [Muribaculum sp.]MCM1482344.1 flavodoxin family protein [Paludibacter sp.]